MKHVYQYLLVGIFLCSTAHQCQQKPEKLNPQRYFYGRWKVVECVPWDEEYCRKEAQEYEATSWEFEPDQYTVTWDSKQKLGPFERRPEELSCGPMYYDGYSYHEMKNDNGPLAKRYSEQETLSWTSISLSNRGGDVVRYYLNGERLIIDDWFDLTFFLKKLPNIERKYQGEGSKRHTLLLTGRDSFLKIKGKTAGSKGLRVTIHDQEGCVLGCKTLGAEVQKLMLQEQATQLVLYIQPQDQDQGDPIKWECDVEVY